MMRPATMLTTVMSTAASASRCVKRMAPSIDAVEVGFAAHALAPLARLALVDDAGVQVGVDRHLPAGHRVEGEPRGDFGDADRAVVDDEELDDDEDDEDDDADDEVAADDELTERHDDVAGRLDAVSAVAAARAAWTRR